MISPENFVQRRLLIRFNRDTRQVYLHRPRYAGGITTLALDQISPQPAVGEDEAANIGRQLVLAWDPAVTGLPHLHLMFVGKVADGTSDIVNLWEFICRYMEEGPQSVPPAEETAGQDSLVLVVIAGAVEFFQATVAGRNAAPGHLVGHVGIASPVAACRRSLDFAASLLGAALAENHSRSGIAWQAGACAVHRQQLAATTDGENVPGQTATIAKAT
ncbi:hypothetical protein JFV28_17515 [Pseudomonas sp. TH05]|uniref:hypothetical protein n=1 Tax=unclassified Pseudomonas TaxID=196821 RepID=UPI001911CCB1|nr:MULTISPECIES: hypothetical protein [unclassified Pseudomonas]MBK5541928.1 hypothetical protein [Pseudomonas sp. TH07]MBK5557648.1 hypothetical protein [Pseudomonas sp. TH05]